MAGDTYTIRIVAQSNLSQTAATDAAAVTRLNQALSQNQVAASRMGAAATNNASALTQQNQHLSNQGRIIQSNRRSLMSMQTAYQAAFGLFAINMVKDFASEFVTMGYNINTATTVVRELSREMGGQAAVMQSLRTHTGGIISDLDLMQQGAKFMAAGFFESNAELSRAIELAVKLGAIAGWEPGRALESFYQGIANKSIRRADQLFIPGETLRANRELTDTEAEAWLLSMEQVAERMGDSLDAPIRGWKQFTTAFENWWASAAGIVERALDPVFRNVAVSLDKGPNVLEYYMQGIHHSIVGGLEWGSPEWNNRMRLDLGWQELSGIFSSPDDFFRDNQASASSINDRAMEYLYGKAGELGVERDTLDFMILEGRSGVDPETRSLMDWYNELQDRLATYSPGGAGGIGEEAIPWHNINISDLAPDQLTEPRSFAMFKELEEGLGALQEAGRYVEYAKMYQRVVETLQNTTFYNDVVRKGSPAEKAERAEEIGRRVWNFDEASSFAEIVAPSMSWEDLMGMTGLRGLRHPDRSPEHISNMGSLDEAEQSQGIREYQKRVEIIRKHSGEALAKVLEEDLFKAGKIYELLLSDGIDRYDPGNLPNALHYFAPESMNILETAWAKMVDLTLIAADSAVDSIGAHGRAALGTSSAWESIRDRVSEEAFKADLSGGYHAYLNSQSRAASARAAALTPLGDNLFPTTFSPPSGGAALLAAFSGTSVTGAHGASDIEREILAIAKRNLQDQNNAIKDAGRAAQDAVRASNDAREKGERAERIPRLPRTTSWNNLSEAQRNELLSGARSEYFASRGEGAIYSARGSDGKQNYYEYISNEEKLGQLSKERSMAQAQAARSQKLAVQASADEVLYRKQYLDLLYEQAALQPGFMIEEDELSRIVDAADEMLDRFTMLEEMDILDQHNIQYLSEARAELEQMARLYTDIYNRQQAMDSSYSALVGVDSPGSLEQAGDQVSAMLREQYPRGIPSNIQRELDKFTQDLAIRGGSANEMSVFMEEEFLPYISDLISQSRPGAAAEALQGFNLGLMQYETDTMARGGTFHRDSAIAAGLGSAGLERGDGRTIQVNPGDGRWALKRRYPWLTDEQINAATGGRGLHPGPLAIGGAGFTSREIDPADRKFYPGGTGGEQDVLTAEEKMYETLNAMYEETQANFDELGDHWQGIMDESLLYTQDAWDKNISHFDTTLTELFKKKRTLKVEVDARDKKTGKRVGLGDFLPGGENYNSGSGRFDGGSQGR